MDSREIMQCRHCGKMAMFEVRAEGRQYGNADLEYDDMRTNTTWRVLECSLCREPTMDQATINYILVFNNNVGHYEISSADRAILYSVAGTKEPLVNLPQTIEKKYLAALKVQHIEPSACAVLAGRTLEAVCNYEKAEGRTLSDKLNNLVSSDRIPKTLAEMAHQLRQIRNLGAHDAEDEVTGEDVPIIMDFLEAILEYLYIAPAKIAKVQSRLKRTS